MEFNDIHWAVLLHIGRPFITGISPTLHFTPSKNSTVPACVTLIVYVIVVARMSDCLLIVVARIRHDHLQVLM